MGREGRKGEKAENLPIGCCVHYLGDRINKAQTSAPCNIPFKKHAHVPFETKIIFFKKRNKNLGHSKKLNITNPLRCWLKVNSGEKKLYTPSKVTIISL